MFYHYTSTYGAQAIKASRFIRQSQGNGAFGPGVYLTDMDPHDYSRDEILRNNYGGISSLSNRADWVVEVHENHIDYRKLIKVDVPGESHRRIWVYQADIHGILDWQVKDKPRCLKSYQSNDSDHKFNQSTHQSDVNYSDPDEVSKRKMILGNFKNVIPQWMLNNEQLCIHYELIDGTYSNPAICYSNTFYLNCGERWISRITSPSGKRIIGLAIYDLDMDHNCPVTLHNTGIGQIYITVTLSAPSSRGANVRVYVFEE